MEADKSKRAGMAVAAWVRWRQKVTAKLVASGKSLSAVIELIMTMMDMIQPNRDAVSKLIEFVDL